MAAPAPVEIGTQGTVASLVSREIEYFRRVEAIVRHGSCHGKKSSKVAASGGSPTVKKPKKSGGAFLPRICSEAAVMEAAGTGSGRKERPARVRYRHLGEEGDYSMLQE